MTCPHCRSFTSLTAGHCAACGRPVTSGRDVAAGVLTPVPAPPNPDDLETGEIEIPSLADPDETGIGRAPTGPSSILDHDVATGVLRDAADDLDLTRLSQPPAAISPTSALRATVGKHAQSGTGPLAVGEVFGRYHIIRVLGVGGMGAVYHAWDGELGIGVALKVIRPETTSDPGAAREMERRFKQELVLARKVTHKNVVRIHDLGEINGIKYISMPYLEGSDLATTLKQKGKMPVAEALSIVRGVASGLVAAHEAGIVHRDLKPANIMIQADCAVIMDFGIARLSGGVTPDSSATMVPSEIAFSGSATSVATMAGIIMGTVQYMAPEQAKGQPADQRADIYALGLIFADMLLGRRHPPGTHANAFEELRSRIEQPPARVRSIDSTIPEAIDELIARAVQPDPAARFQTSAELVAELDRLDENGVPIPIRRVVRLPFVMAMVAVLLALSGGTWWYFRSLVPPPAHAPVTVVIADFQNNTKDPTFDRTLESVLQRQLEGASFISAYDRSSINRFLGVQPPQKLDEAAAWKLALNQGVGVVLSASLGPRGQGYEVHVKAVETVTEKVITEVTGRASGRDQVVPTVASLANDVREALGDETSDSRFSKETIEKLSATSLDVVRQYVVAMDALSNSKNEEALKRFAEAVKLDPDFGLAYAGMASASWNLDRQQEAEKYAKEAVQLVARMTDRERLRTRGLFYLVTRDYQNCVKEYNDLIKAYAADAAGHNNLALCSTHLRDFSRSLEARRKAATILPKRSVYRFNLAVDATYAGDFKTGEEEALKAQELGSPRAPVALAFVQLAQGRTKEVADTYEKLGTTNAAGASRAASGLGELAAYEGRFSDAVRILERGATADLAAKNAERAADKFAALAAIQVLRQQKNAALDAAQKALANSPSVKIHFLTARVFVEAGEIGRAQKAAAALGSELQAEPRALGKVIEGEIALKQGDPPRAILALNDANQLMDTWIGRLDLGRAYLAAGLPTQADSELDRCITRRGEALSLFLDDEPTFSYLPQVYYYQGRVREAGKISGFADSYRTYLAIRGTAGEDPLLGDVKRRIR